MKSDVVTFACAAGAVSKEASPSVTAPASATERFFRHCLSFHSQPFLLVLRDGLQSRFASISLHLTLRHLSFLWLHLQKLWYLILWHFFLEGSDAHALRLPLHFFLGWLQEHLRLFAAFLHSLRLLMAAQGPSFWDVSAARRRASSEASPSTAVGRATASGSDGEDRGPRASPTGRSATASTADSARGV